MSQITPLSQNDPRWSGHLINNTSSTIGRYGCTLTCLAMLQGVTPDIFEASMYRVGGFLRDLILWQKIEAATGGRLKQGYRYYSFDVNKVEDAVNKYGGCLVEVDWDGSPRTSGRHWVLYIPEGKMIDPWDGQTKLRGAYPLKTGFDVIVVEQPPDEGGDDMEKLPKDSVIGDTYQILTGARPSEDTMKWRLDSGKNIVEIGEDIASGDDAFITRWGYRFNTTPECEQEKQLLQEQVDKLSGEVSDLTAQLVEANNKLAQIKQIVS